MSNTADRSTQNEQDAEMNRLIIRLTFEISHGACQTYGGPVSRGESTAVYPSGTSKPRYEKLGNSYRDARNWGEREDVIEQARVEVAALVRTVPIIVVTETREQLEDRMATDDMALDLTPLQVISTTAYRSLTARQVASARIRADRDPETGRPREARGEDWEIRARQLLEAGKSLNYTAFALKMHRKTLTDWARINMPTMTELAA